MHIFKQACAFLAVTALVLGMCGASWADEQLGYYRWPTTYGDKVVFTSEGDLWEAPLSGGMARRLTSALGEERFAMYSPDGRWIVTASGDGTVRVWSWADIEGLLAAADSRITRELTCWERVQYLHETLDCEVEVP